MTAFSNNKITAHLPLLFPCALCQRSLWPVGPPISAELEPPSEKETTINTPLVHAHCKITVFWDKTDHPLNYKSYCFLKRKPLAWSVNRCGRLKCCAKVSPPTPMLRLSLNYRTTTTTTTIITTTSPIIATPISFWLIALNAINQNIFPTLPMNPVAPVMKTVLSL